MFIENYSIPPNVTIVVISHLVHRNENIYANAEEFIPERFLDNESKNKFLFGYIPFSAGPRNCIGNNLYLFNIQCHVFLLFYIPAMVHSAGWRGRLLLFYYEVD